MLRHELESSAQLDVMLTVDVLYVVTSCSKLSKVNTGVFQTYFGTLSLTTDPNRKAPITALIMSRQPEVVKTTEGSGSERLDKCVNYQ